MKENVARLPAPVHPRRGVVIGSRYTPRHIVRRDDETGQYEELNSPAHNSAEDWIQRVLLADKRPAEASTWLQRRGMWLATAIAILLTFGVAYAQSRAA